MNNNIETNNKMQQLNNLYSFLDKYRIVKADNKAQKPSHLSMDTYVGSFNIPDDKINHLLKYYQKAVKADNIPSLLESHLDQGPIIIDLDFKYILKSSSTTTRIYTDLDIENIISIYNQIILTYLSINEEDLNIYILEKKLPKIVNTNDILNEITYKDGVHIIYPFICASNKLQFFFRELVVNKIIQEKILDHLNLANTIDDVFDKAIIERNNWLLYGSCKTADENYVYKLTRIYDVNLKLLDLDEVDWFNLPTLLSIRKFKLAEDHSEYIEGMNMEKINALYNEIIGKKTNNKSYTLNTDINKARVLCSMLGAKRAKDYSSWIEVGFCLHNIDESLLEDWIDFSKKSSTGFKDGECEKLWVKFKYEGLSIGSLYRWAKEDNPEAYSDYLIAELENILKNSIKNTSYAVAIVFYELNRYQYVCTSISKKKWYEYINNRWEPMDEANTIIKKLNTELTNDYIKLGIAYGQKALHTDNEYIKKDLLSKSKTANIIAEKLGSMCFKKEIIKELMHLYYDSKFMLKLDENRYLLGFNNGVYDLKSNYFRNGRPEDYISMSTNCDYIKYDESDKQIINVYNFFEQIQPDIDMRNYLLLKLSSFLEGIQRDQKFEIWTGTGANGKGRILKLVIDALGDYACTIPITLLTKPRSDSNSVTPALAMTKGKRCCVFQEPENDDKIYVGHMKNITGGDKLMARSLYSDPVEFYPQFKTILACNKLPDIPSADGGTWRRIRVVPFETKFVDNPTETNHRKKINNIDDLIGEWKSAFLSILIEKYKYYIKNGIDEPAKVLIHTNEYQNNSDVYMEYIRDNILSTTDKDYISSEDVWEDFKKWYKDSNRPDNKKPLKPDLKIEMEIRLGKIYKGKYYGYRFKTNIDQDIDENTSITERLNSSFNQSIQQQKLDVEQSEDPIDNLFIKKKTTNC
jgi:P4 family phage/plasmid primase-like protien